jgi:hypothetical protein
MRRYTSNGFWSFDKLFSNPGGAPVNPASPSTGAKNFAKGFAKGFALGEAALFVAGCMGAVVGTGVVAPEAEANPYMAPALCIGGGLGAALNPASLSFSVTVGTLEGLWDAFQPVFEPKQTVPSAGR